MCPGSSCMFLEILSSGISLLTSSSVELEQNPIHLGSFPSLIPAILVSPPPRHSIGLSAHLYPFHAYLGLHLLLLLPVLLP